MINKAIEVYLNHLDTTMKAEELVIKRHIATFSLKVLFNE